jgi:hypothetical protein
MFEKWFGGKKKVEGINSDKNSVEGVAHFDGTKTEKDLSQDENEHLQDKFDQNDSAKKVSDLRERDAQNFGTSWRESSMKVSNERNHPKLGEKHSDWKEKAVFDEPLSKEEISDEHLDALMQQEENTKFVRDNFYPEEYDEDEDIDLEKAA